MRRHLVTLTVAAMLWTTPAGAAGAAPTCAEWRTLSLEQQVSYIHGFADGVTIAMFYALAVSGEGTAEENRRLANELSERVVASQHRVGVYVIEITAICEAPSEAARTVREVFLSATRALRQR